MVSNAPAVAQDGRKTWRNLISTWMGLTPAEPAWATADLSGEWADLLQVGTAGFAIEFSQRSDFPSLAAAVERVRSHRQRLPPDVVPLLAVQHMGPLGIQFAREAGIDWIDLAGNASITQVPGLRILVLGNLPTSTGPGRKPNVFAVKSSRLAHWFLLNAGVSFTQAELALNTGLDRGQLSRLLVRLLDLQVIRKDEGRYRLANARVLLEGWREAYRPPARGVRRGLVPARTGVETMQLIASVLGSGSHRYVFGGLGAAWLWAPFADFRLVTCYVEGRLDDAHLEAMGFVPAERGGNLWLMEDSDAGVFLGSEQRDGLMAASPWFTYVDLSAHPERSKEAAAHLRTEVLRIGGAP